MYMEWWTVGLISVGVLNVEDVEHWGRLCYVNPKRYSFSESYKTSFCYLTLTIIEELDKVRK